MIADARRASWSSARALVLVAAAGAGCLNDAPLARYAGDAGDADGGDAAVRADGTAGPLRVAGEVQAGGEASNAQDGAQFVTQFFVTVTRDDAPVTDAVVTMSSALGALRLTRTDDAYAGTQTGYAPPYTLEIVASEAHLGPIAFAPLPVHVFSAPAIGTHVASGADLAVLWAPAGATSATVEMEELSELVIGDTGRYVVPGSALTAAPGEHRATAVRVRRRLDLAVPGAADGSSLRFQVRNDASFVVDGP